MTERNKKEIIVAVVLILLILLFINPFYFWMPDQLEKIMLAGLIIVFGIFSNFVLKDNPQDERERNHLMKASKLGYFAGGLSLVVAILVQTINGELDKWLLVVLGVMVLVKALTFVYNQKNN